MIYNVYWFFHCKFTQLKSIVYISFLILIFFMFCALTIYSCYYDTYQVPIILFPKKIPYNFVFHNICTIFAAAKRTKQ